MSEIEDGSIGPGSFIDGLKNSDTKSEKPSSTSSDEDLNTSTPTPIEVSDNTDGIEISFEVSSDEVGKSHSANQPSTPDASDLSDNLQPTNKFESVSDSFLSALKQTKSPSSTDGSAHSSDINHTEGSSTDSTSIRAVPAASSDINVQISKTEDGTTTPDNLAKSSKAINSNSSIQDAVLPDKPNSSFSNAYEDSRDKSSDAPADGSKVKSPKEQNRGEKPPVMRGRGERPSRVARAANLARNPKASAAAGVDSAKSAVKNTAKNSLKKNIKRVGQKVAAQAAAAILTNPTALAIIGSILAVILFIVFIISIFGGVGSVAQVDASKIATQSIPASYLDAYQSSAEEYNVPWTVLAAVGQRASYHGQFDPYKFDVPAYYPGSGTNAMKSLTFFSDSSSEYLVEGLTTAVNARGVLFNNVSIDDIYDLPSKVISGLKSIISDNLPNSDPSISGAGRYLVVSALPDPEAEDVQTTFTKIINDVFSKSSADKVIWIGGLGPEYAEINKILLKQSTLRNFIVTLPTSTDLLSQITSVAFAQNSAFASSPGFTAVLDSGCPVRTPSIQATGKDANTGKPAGPLMLLPGVSKLDNSELQNICNASDALAENLSETSILLSEERDLNLRELEEMATDGDVHAANLIHSFWADVVNASNIIGDKDTAVCEKPNRGDLKDAEWVALMVKRSWECVLAGSEINVATSIVNGSYVTLDSINSIELVVEEALDVSFAWSGWKIPSSACAVNSGAAGTFPLDLATYTANIDLLNPKAGRCDVWANSNAAARAFLKAQIASEAARSVVNGEGIQGGWKALPLTLGPYSNQFFVRGQYVDVAMISVCTDAAYSSFKNMVLSDANPLNSQNNSYDDVISIINGSPDGSTTASALSLSALTTSYVLSEAADLTTSGCGGAGRVLTVAESLSILDQAAIKYSREVPFNATSDKVVDAGVVSVAISSVISREAVSAPSGVPIARGSGRTALTNRLNITELVSNRPQVASFSGNNLSAGTDIVNIAGIFGGLFVGDKAGGTGWANLGTNTPKNEIFNAVGSSVGVDPRLLASIAFVESRFDESFNCPQGSKNKPAGIMGLNKTSSFDPCAATDDTGVEVSIQTAAASLKQAGTLYPNNWPAALIYYKAGSIFPGQEKIAADSFVSSGVGSIAKILGDAEAAIISDYIDANSNDNSVIYKWGQLIEEYPALTINSVQISVSADGCPVNAPPSTVQGFVEFPLLRDGAREFGLHKICVDSVRQAATPEAARAIKYALTQLGTEYILTSAGRMRTNPNAFDCSSFVTRSYSNVLGGNLPITRSNWAPTTRDLLGIKSDPWYVYLSWAEKIPFGQAKPGDLVFGGDYGTSHVTMLLAHGFKVHTNSPRDVAHVNAAYSSAIYAVRVNPDRVYTKN